MSRSEARYGLHVVGDPSPALAAALGTVPSFFQVTDDPATPHISWVTPGDDWAASASTELDRGATAILVEAPPAPSVEDINRLSGRAVALVTASSHAPQLRGLRESTSRLLGNLALVEVLIVDGSPTPFSPLNALWDAASTLVGAGLPIDSVPIATCSAGVITADATVGAARVHITVVHRDGQDRRTTIKAFGVAGSVEARVGDPTAATPGSVVWVSAGDAALEASDYETPVRAALLDAHAYLGGVTAALRGSTDEFAHTAYLLSQVVWGDVQSEYPNRWKEEN